MSRLSGRPASAASSTRFLSHMLEPAAIERAGQRVAAGARQQILVALAIGEEVEHIDDARRALGALARQLDPAQIDRAEDAVDRDRRHFRDPAAEQHRKRRAGEKAQARIERELIETSAPARRSAPAAAARGRRRRRASARRAGSSDAIGEQDQRAPHHQRAHLVEKTEIGMAVRRQRSRRRGAASGRRARTAGDCRSAARRSAGAPPPRPRGYRPAAAASACR